MDFLRFGYRAKARLWSDSPEEVEIRWFRCDPLAKDAPTPNMYVSGVFDDVKADRQPTIGEIPFAPRTWDAGANTLGYTGQNHCGDFSAWTFGGIHEIDPVIVTDTHGASTCCAGLALVGSGGSAAGGRAVFSRLKFPKFPFAGGKEVGGAFGPSAVFVGGLEKGGTFSPAPAFVGGLEKGGTFSPAPAFVGGLEKGGAFGVTAIRVEPFAGGKGLGGRFDTEYLHQYSMDGGKEVGGYFDQSQEFAGGLEKGGSFGPAPGFAGGKEVGGAFGPSAVFVGGKEVGGAFGVSQEFAGGKEVGGAFGVIVEQDVLTGTILGWGAAAAPAGYLLCDGTLYLRNTYPDLFAVIGLTFGPADGTHFYVPDLRSRVPIGAGTGTGLSNRPLGQVGGAETHAMTLGELVTHHHVQNIPNSAVGGSMIDTFASYATGSGQLNQNETTGDTGSSTAWDQMNPWGAITFIIKT